jgi:hypothetical protein
VGRCGGSSAPNKEHNQLPTAALTLVLLLRCHLPHPHHTHPHSNYIDRTNLAFASVQLNADIGLSPSVYGLGSGLFFISYACECRPRWAACATASGMFAV